MGPSQKQPVKKVLICAPSNAAIDEVVKRLMLGVRDMHGNRIVPKVVRIGNESSMHHSVMDVALETLVDKKLNGENKDKGSVQDINNEMTKLRTEITAVKEDKQKKQQEMAATVNNAARALALEEEFKRINSRWMSLSQRLNQLKDKQRAASRSADADRRRFRLEILDEADVICSTLSGSGHELLNKYEFEMIVIDEAAQSIELSSLIPLKYRCNRIVMVGGTVQGSVDLLW
jgi:senataxin